MKYVCDSRIEQLNSITAMNFNIKTTTNYDDVLCDSEVDAVIIALPVKLHYIMAKKALLAGKHVLVEKPMTDSVEQAEELVNIAKKHNLVLMVDHTLLYTDAAREIKKRIESGELGKIQYFDSTRINLGLFQTDVNVVWDLVPHDVALSYYFNNEVPTFVFATGFDHAIKGKEDIAYISMKYPNSISHFSVSWISPIKVRKIIMGFDKKMVVFDDLEPIDKVKIYNSGYVYKNDCSSNTNLFEYKSNGITCPSIDCETEALTFMAKDFIGSIENKRKPISDAELGYMVVKIIKSIDDSLKEGKEIKL